MVNNPCWKMKPFLACPYFAAKRPISQQFLPTNILSRFFSRHYPFGRKAIADHKILTSAMLFHTARSREHLFRFQKTPDLAKPGETPIDQRFQFCHEFLTANPAPSLPCLEIFEFVLSWHAFVCEENCFSTPGERI